MAGSVSFWLVLLFGWFEAIAPVMAATEAPGNTVPEPAAVAVLAFGLAAVVRRAIGRNRRRP